MVYALFGGLALVLLLQWKTYRRIAGPALEPGDIVLYVNPGEDDPLNNMITQVLSVDGDSVSYRGRGDTLKGSTVCGARKKHFTRLPVDQHHPLQVPTQPVSMGFSPAGDQDTNGATWMEIPLEWFPYIISKKMWGPQKTT